MKTSITLKIEQLLIDSCFSSNNKSLARRYGCTEVKIGFPTKPIKDQTVEEFADFITYDKETEMIACYEIKVTAADLLSKARKSWYGHYNYLVITNDMWKQLSPKKKYFDTIIPDYVGIVVADLDNETLSCKRYTKRQTLSITTVELLKDSLIRSLFYKWQKAERRYKTSIGTNETDLDNTIEFI